MFVERGFQATSVRDIAAAASLCGAARTRRILTGLLEALEVHSGVAVAALRHGGIDGVGHALAAQSRPLAYDLLRQEVADDDADLRVRMLVGAVERVVVELMLAAESGEAFVRELRARREAIVDLAMGLAH
jgi:hypothetical protein